MPRKIYTIENLDCANCAAKMEAKFNALPAVQEAVITFATQQLRLTAADPDGLIPELQKIARTVESQVIIHPGETVHKQTQHHHEHEEHHHHEGCCGHDHNENRHEYTTGGDDKKVMILGALLFAAGVAFDLIGLNIGAVIGFIAAYLVLGWEVIATAGKNLLKGHVFDENFLMSLATVGAFVIGEYPEAVGIMLFYRLGEYFEHKAVERSRSQIIEAVDLRPEVVNLLSGEETIVITAEAAKVGDILLVRPGDRIPLDGTVVSGESRIDTAPITGEPVPIAVKPGDPIISGCVNTSGQLTIRVDKPLSESMVTRILNSVENAAASKPKIDRFITRFSRVYTPVVVALAVGTAVIPSLIDGRWDYWVYTALSFLVMSCPCALVLSVPLAFFSGIGAGSKRGILFKGGLSMEALAGVKAVVMDKTGTITNGTFAVQKVEGGEEILRLCASLERSSTHPIAVSIVAAAQEQGLVLSSPQALEEIAGHGIRGAVDGNNVLCGNEKWMARFGIAVPEESGEQSGTRVWVAVNGAFAGTVWISDTLKPDAAAAVKQLKAMGVAAAMLTGDRPAAAQAVAKAAGIQEVYAKLLPEDKLSRLQELRRKYGPVMFVGDGINDAPVLSGADVGAAMGSGADAAIEAADVVFMTSQVSAVPEALQIARRTQHIAWQNVVFALTVKAVVMVLGLLGYASMWAAVFADSGVAMLCVLNAIRLLHQKKRQER